MKHIVKVLLAVTMATSLLVGPAAAHVRTADTALKLSANHTTIHKGKGVTFTATLKSNWKKCYSQRRVHLYKDGVHQFYKGTNTAGVAKFTVHPNKTHHWYVRFNGRKWGTHPHKHTCLASQSKTIKIVVKP